jgi:tRNA1(Val) A37 N6-methylase TrmN6
MTIAGEAVFTVDAFLGGLVEAVQPDDGGHRSGLDAVLLAAAIDAGFAGVVVDLGAGAGVAGMCVAVRCRAARVTLVDRDAAALAAARASLSRPANRSFASRVSIIAADVTAPEAERVAAGLGRAAADAVILNPPFHDGNAGTRSPSEGRADAHVLADGGLEPWLRTSASVLTPGGTVIAIFKAEGIGALLAALGGRFGSVTILPVHPRAGLPAHRVIVRAVKGSRTPLSLLPGLTLHPATGSAYLPEAEAILRNGMGLADVHPPWRA